ncbi:hypothetical protein, partial [Marichromatium sp. AB32]|uniref:hypothetical protein n=1 Tax=Marichromatium sp. AB32 TaxID=2483363 RepID=UPI001CC1C2B3
RWRLAAYSLHAKCMVCDVGVRPQAARVRTHWRLIAGGWRLIPFRAFAVQSPGRWRRCLAHP